MRHSASTVTRQPHTEVLTSKKTTLYSNEAAGFTNSTAMMLQRFCLRLISLNFWTINTVTFPFPYYTPQGPCKSFKINVEGN